MKFILFGISYLVCLLSFAQSNQNINYLEIDNSKLQPDSSENIFLDCNTDDCDSFFKKLNEYKNLKRLYISKFKGKTIPENSIASTNIESLTIEKSPNLNLAKLFKQVNNKTLTNLSIKDNNLSKLPSNIKAFKALKSINIANNSKLNIEKAIDQLATLPNIEDVYLPVNSISELPNNITQLKNLKTLDISNNYLQDLPDGISELRKLEELSIEGNLIDDPSNSLAEAANINLKYLSLDDGLSDEEKKKLKELFPNAEIKEVNPNELEEIEEEDITSENIIPLKKDSINNKKTETTPTTTRENDITYGELSVKKHDLKIYSQAYIHYPDVFKIKRFSNFDSTMFEERFIDTTYANTVKIQFFNSNPLVYENLQITKYKGEKGEIWFNFNGITSSWLNRNNPELNAFIGMSWVYAGNLTLDEFKKKYFYKEDYKWYKPSKWAYRNKWKLWTDVRITYNNEAQNFTIKLKDLKGFTEIIAYPRYRSLNRQLEESQKTYVKRYDRYSRTLDTRKRRFEKRNMRDKVKHEKSLIKADNKKWASFQKNYMSKEERELSREEWLTYYDKVIANEKKAMGNASPSIDNIKRSMKLDGYNKSFSWQANQTFARDSSFIEPIKSLFQTADSGMVAIKEILVIDANSKTYQAYPGSLGVRLIQLNLIQGSSTIIVAQLRNNDIGYIKGNTFQQIKFPKNNKYKFTLNRINAKIGSVEMVRTELGF